MINSTEKKYLRKDLQDDNYDPQRYIMGYLNRARLTAPILHESGKPLDIPKDLLEKALFLAETLGHPQTTAFVTAAYASFEEIYL